MTVVIGFVTTLATGVFPAQPHVRNDLAEMPLSALAWPRTGHRPRRVDHQRPVHHPGDSPRSLAWARRMNTGLSVTTSAGRFRIDDQVFEDLTRLHPAGGRGAC
jgi:hypothetical protein